jgi:hypothetical protein
MGSCCPAPLRSVFSPQPSPAYQFIFPSGPIDEVQSTGGSIFGRRQQRSWPNRPSTGSTQTVRFLRGIIQRIKVL